MAAPAQVELRNDAIVRGLLDSADAGMNLTLSAATWQPLQGDAQAAEFLFLRGNNVRCRRACATHLRSFLMLMPGGPSSCVALLDAARRTVHGPRTACSAASFRTANIDTESSFYSVKSRVGAIPSAGIK